MATTNAKICRKKYTITDYAHRRPKMLQRKEKPCLDPHRHHFFHGVKSTSLTDHLRCTPPSHAYHPDVQDSPPPAFHRKSSPITENVLGCRVKRFSPSDPEYWFNRQATDVTEQLRFVPPSHAQNSEKPDPWYGRTRTYVTNPEVDDYTVFQTKPNSSTLKREKPRSECTHFPSSISKEDHQCPASHERDYS